MGNDAAKKLMRTSMILAAAEIALGVAVGAITAWALVKYYKSKGQIPQ